jgi:hypothetical protein
MSDANKADYEQHLSSLTADLARTIERAREQNLASYSARGLLQSGAAMVAGARILTEQLDRHIDQIAVEISDWIGDQLSEAEAKAMATGHLRNAIETFATCEYAYRLGTRQPRDSAMEALAGRIANDKVLLLGKVRKIELGVMSSSTSSGPVNVIHAGTINGGVQQAGSHAKQEISIHINRDDTLAAIQALLDAIDDDDLRAAITPDVQTIEAQLSKSQPSSTITSEAGRSIRSVVEGALGGALGNAASPGIGAALSALMSALGVS